MSEGHPPESPSTTAPREHPEEREIFARNFKAARKSAGLSQRDIHKLTGIGYTYLSRVETCQQSISLDNMAILAAVVKMPLYKLLRP